MRWSTKEELEDNGNPQWLEFVEPLPWLVGMALISAAAMGVLWRVLR